MAPLRLQLELWKHEKQTRTSQILSIANQGERACFRLKTEDLRTINKKPVWATVTNFVSSIFINIIKKVCIFLKQVSPYWCSSELLKYNSNHADLELKEAL